MGILPQPKNYLLIPVPKNPCSRIGPEMWQDYYRQIKKTIKIARELKTQGNEVRIAIISNFQAKGKPSEIEIYTKVFNTLAPELIIDCIKETNDTLGQVEKSFELQKETGEEIIFISTWMHYPRLRYLTRGKHVLHYGVFGIPQPSFALIDPFCIVLQPLVDIFCLSNFFQQIIVGQREKGKIL